jgi:hypothetical protein
MIKSQRWRYLNLSLVGYEFSINMITAGDLRLTRLARVSLRLKDIAQLLTSATKEQFKDMRKYAKTFSKAFHNFMKKFALI